MNGDFFIGNNSASFIFVFFLEPLNTGGLFHDESICDFRGVRSILSPISFFFFFFFWKFLFANNEEPD